MKRLFFLLLIISGLPVLAQKIVAPIVKKDYSYYTSYDELTKYINQLAGNSGLMKVEPIGKSMQGRNLYAMKFSLSEFGKDTSKIKVLFFAQQHGNEQSGKEGALLLAQLLLGPENLYLFNRIDLAIIPQMNPDGSEAKKRLNGNETDLNRNHLIITEPEIIALHQFFDRYLFEVTMDVHEYYPFGETWKKAGYMINSDELTGPVNNPNVSENIKKLSDTSFLPYIKKYFTDRHFTNSIYSPGGPPGINYIRHSTFDINDGRQSFGIQNTFSFIQEGINGKDYSADNLKHRAEGQMTGMRGLLEFTYQNKKKIKDMVTADRRELINRTSDAVISIQCEHTPNGQKIDLPVLSYSTGIDTVLTVVDYRPVVKSLYDVGRPEGYLIPKKLKELTDWTNRQGIIQKPFTNSGLYKIEQYEILNIDSIDFEGDTIVNPAITAAFLQTAVSADDYIYVPTSQLKGNLIVIALEPKSMLGLVTYKEFAHLLKSGGKFPVLRVVRKQVKQNN
jgi:hypothetical protein